MTQYISYQDCRGVKPPIDPPEFRFTCCGWCNLPKTFTGHIGAVTATVSTTPSPCASAPAPGTTFTLTKKVYEGVLCYHTWTVQLGGVGIGLTMLPERGRWPVCDAYYSSGSEFTNMWRPATPYIAESVTGSCYIDPDTHEVVFDFFAVLNIAPGCTAEMIINGWGA